MYICNDVYADTYDGEKERTGMSAKAEWTITDGNGMTHQLGCAIKTRLAFGSVSRARWAERHCLSENGGKNGR